MIEADNDSDAWFELGFCHGRDRATQLALIRRASNGTVSELVGRNGLPIEVAGPRDTPVRRPLYVDYFVPAT